MVFTSAIEVLPAVAYNNLPTDHEAKSQSEARDLKTAHVATLIGILRAHKLEGDLEIHLLHRHFQLQDGEAIIHKEISLGGKDPDIPGVKIDIAKVMKCPDHLTTFLAPVMWYSAEVEKLVPYEYAIDLTPQPNRAASKVPTSKLDTFAKDFSAYVWGAGLQNLVSLKDKSCVAGFEYVAPEFQALFKVPNSIVNLQTNSGLIETGWTLDSEGKDPFLQSSDTHVTKTRQTTGGTVATYHDVVQSGDHSFDPREISPAYTEQMWAAVETTAFKA